MVKLANTFGHFRPFKALVLGDFVLDTYTTGRVKRVSPEAPVPVMEVTKCESRPGCAGNVVLNLATIGAEVFAVGRLGADEEGKILKARLEQEGIRTDSLVVEPSYRTIVKNRLIADSQQLLRIDFETVTPLDSAVENEVIERLRILIPKVQIVALSDYGKGFLTNRIISEALQIAKKCKVPTIVDPKGSDFTKYRGSTMLKPNLSEAYAAAKLPMTAPLNQVAAELIEIADTDLLLITRSEAGISIFERDGTRTDFPVRTKEVKDVTGAGDTVLAIICLGMANGLDIHVSAQLANLAAGIAIERLGCVQITLAEIARRLLAIDSESKVFDESHTFALKAVLEGRRYTLLVLEKEQGMSNALFRTIRQLAKIEGMELMVYVQDAHPKDEFIHLLSSLQEIDYIIVQSESLKNLYEAIHPHEVYTLSSGEARKIEPAKELLAHLIQKSEVCSSVGRKGQSIE